MAEIVAKKDLSYLLGGTFLLQECVAWNTK